MRHFLRNCLTASSAILVFSLLALFAQSVRAQTAAQLPPAWDDGAHLLAQRIVAAVTSAHTLSVTGVQDVTIGAPVDLSALRQSIQSEITAEGGRLVQLALGSAAAAPADAQVEIAVSHDVNGFLLVANIALGGSKQVVVAPVAVPPLAPGPPGPEPVLHRQVVWQQSAPILDFAEGSPDANHTIWYILQPDRLAAYEFSGSSQILHVDEPFSRLYTSRDPRGHLTLTDPTHVVALVAAARCEGAWNPGFSLNCSPNVGQQWPAGTVSWAYDPNHNYFSGLVTLSGSLTAHYPPFYSAAFPPGESGGSTSRWILAGLNGQALLFTGSAEASAAFFGWGSDVTSLSPACGPGWQVMVTGPGDWTEPDRIQLYQVANRQASAVGEPLQFPGPVLSMWPSSDNQSARVVFRNLRTGMYEASIVSVSCSD